MRSSAARAGSKLMRPGVACQLLWLALACCPAFVFAQTQAVAQGAARTVGIEAESVPPLLRAVRSLTSPLSRTPAPDFFAATPAGEPQSGRKPEPGQAQNQTNQPAPVLTLDEVLALVESNHPKLLGADAERRVASAKRLEKQGAFDPVINFGSDFLRYNSTSRPGSLLEARTNDMEVEWLTRSGVKLFAGSRYNFGNVKSPLSATGEAGEYYVGVKVPFLRGRGINEKAAAERQALIGEPLAAEQLTLTRLELQLKAAEVYWEWVAAKRKLDVARSLLELAKVRTDAVRERVAAGDLPRIDTTEAEQEVRRREGGAVKAERDLQKAAFKLSLFLWDAGGQPMSAPTAANVPPSLPPPARFADEREVEGQRVALERRPELKIISLSRDITQVDLVLGRNRRLPAVDFTFSPGRDTGPGGVGATLKAGLTISLPLRQRTAEGQIEAAQLKMQKLDFDLQNQRQAILVEVRDALNAINTTYERYRAAEQEVRLARELEEGERTRFSFGDSTLFLVNQRERATAEAENKLIEIHAEYEQAVAAFRAVTGSFRP
jgi:outer membrane protein